MTAASDDPLLRFYRQEGPDSQGRLLRDIWFWSNQQLEAVHDYIQWLFPLPEPSAFNPAAPLLTADAIEAFHTEARLQHALKASLTRMLTFYGLGSTSGPITVHRNPAFGPETPHWLRRGNHNHLRLTRIIGSLRLLGLTTHATALFACLEQIARDHPDAISATTLAYWRSASERRL